MTKRRSAARRSMVSSQRAAARALASLKRTALSARRSSMERVKEVRVVSWKTSVISRTRVSPAATSWPTRVRPDHGSTMVRAAATAHQGRHVAAEDARARADLQHAPAGPDSAEAKEAAPQPDLAGRAPARLQKGHILFRIRLPVDGAIGIGVSGHPHPPFTRSVRARVL